MSIKTLYTVCILAGLMSYISAQGQVVEEEVVPELENSTSDYDEEEVQPEQYEYGIEERRFEEPLAEKYTGKDFDYTEEPIETEKKPASTSNNSAWNNFWSSVFQNIATFFAHIGEFLLYFILGIAGFIVLFILFQNIVGRRWSQNPFRKKHQLKEKSQSLAVEENPDDIADNDYKRLAQRAESENNYRLAFRYLYLDMLQQLDLKTYIDWRKNKTNLEYGTEIQKEPIQKEYIKLAHLFNYIWYGEQAIEDWKYDHYKSDIHSLTQQL